MTPKRRGLTLVELLVSVALGTILIGVITFIWLQSTKIFSSTVNNLESYQRLRTAMDQLERDIANADRTVDMEFFKDANNNGHFDPTSEKVLGHQAPMGGEGAGATAGASSFRRVVDQNDPVFKLPGTSDRTEFYEGGGHAPNANFSSQAYFFAPTIFSPPPYAITGSAYVEKRHYWRDELYLRTVTHTSIDGATVPALVHYRLVQPAAGASTSLLRRRVWWQDPSRAIVGANTAPAATDRGKHTDVVTVLANGLCDLKFAFFLRASSASDGSSAEGNWFHVGCPVTPEPSSPTPKPLFRADADRGFVQGLDTSAGISAQHVSGGGSPHLGGANGISFFYQGFARFEKSEAGPVLLRTIKALNSAAPSDAELDEYTNFDFPGVRPGDQIYVFGARDDDAIQAGGAPSGGAAPAGVFPDRLLTCDEIVSHSNPLAGGPTHFVAMKVRERIEFDELKRYWLGAEFAPDVSYTVPANRIRPSDPGKDAGPVRTLQATINVGYRVSFLPAAVLVRLSIDDSYNQQIRVVERVIRLVQR